MESLAPAIRAISKGEYWIGGKPVASLVQALHNLASEPALAEKKVPTLTPRELEVVVCIVRGSSNRDIAQEFQLSEETVKRHISNIFEKTGVSTRLELALFAIENQLVALPA
jgi:DNA-binding NarL/FixJ family response regulator